MKWYAVYRNGKYKGVAPESAKNYLKHFNIQHKRIDTEIPEEKLMEMDEAVLEFCNALSPYEYDDIPDIVSELLSDMEKCVTSVYEKIELLKLPKDEMNLLKDGIYLIGYFASIQSEQTYDFVFKNIKLILDNFD